MSEVLRDLRYSVRMLVKSPVFTAAAVLTLALGIGLNAATFSAVRGILLRPLGGAQAPEELVQVYLKWPGMDFGSVSIPLYHDLRDRSGGVFEDLAAYYFTPMSLAVEGRSERTLGMLVSANFFQTYGVTAEAGRVFLPDSEARGPGSHPVAILGHGFWQDRFGADPGIVGRTMTLNGQPFDVVGVAPADFKGPVTFAAVPIYVPLMMQMQVEPGVNLIEARGNSMMTAVGRLREGQTLESAQQAVDAILRQVKEEHPDAHEHLLGATLVLQNEAGIHPMFRSAQMGMSAVMMVVVGLLLLIACVNVANLFLARARERRREMGVRLSLGAGRRRIVQQLLTESLVFSALAGLAGLVLARVAIGFLRGVRPPLDGPWDFGIAMDETVLLFTLVVSLASGFVFGLAPALQAARPDLVSAVRGVSDARAGRSRLSNGLVVVQMALSLFLLVSAGLFLRSLQGATRIDPGFDEPNHLVMASVDPGLQGYGTERSREFLDRLVAEVAALPEVTAVGLIDQMPLSVSGSDRGVEIPGYDFAEGERRSIHYARVTEGYLDAMGVELIAGRTFTRQDDAAGAPVIVVNQRFAERFWPGESALGKVVETAGKDREVVGVVQTGKYRSLGEPPTEFMFLPQRELFTTGMSLVARTRSDPGATVRTLQEIVRSLDAEMPVFDVRTMEDHMGIALLPARLGGTVLGLFGLLGLTLAAVGIYGVTAYSVARRKRELGIRVAMGADRSSVLRLVLGEGLRTTALGVALGLAAALGAARLVRGLLYDTNAFDPVAFVGVPVVLAAVALLAVYLPARRAAGAEPMRALRAE
jgi:predicted permease